MTGHTSPHNPSAPDKGTVRGRPWVTDTNPKLTRSSSLTSRPASKLQHARSASVEHSAASNTSGRDVQAFDAMLASNETKKVSLSSLAVVPIDSAKEAVETQATSGSAARDTPVDERAAAAIISSGEIPETTQLTQSTNGAGELGPVAATFDGETKVVPGLQPASSAAHPTASASQQAPELQQKTLHRAELAESTRQVASAAPKRPTKGVGATLSRTLSLSSIARRISRNRKTNVDAFDRAHSPGVAGSPQRRQSHIPTGSGLATIAFSASQDSLSRPNAHTGSSRRSTRDFHTAEKAFIVDASRSGFHRAEKAFIVDAPRRLDSILHNRGTRGPCETVDRRLGSKRERASATLQPAWTPGGAEPVDHGETRADGGPTAEQVISGGGADQIAAPAAVPDASAADQLVVPAAFPYASAACHNATTPVTTAHDGAGSRVSNAPPSLDSLSPGSLTPITVVLKESPCSAPSPSAAGASRPLCVACRPEGHDEKSAAVEASDEEAKRGLHNGGNKPLAGPRKIQSEEESSGRNDTSVETSQPDDSAVLDLLREYATPQPVRGADDPNARHDVQFLRGENASLRKQLTLLSHTLDERSRKHDLDIERFERLAYLAYQKLANADSRKIAHEEDDQAVGERSASPVSAQPLSSPGEVKG